VKFAISGNLKLGSLSRDNTIEGKSPTIGADCGRERREREEERRPEAEEQGAGCWG